jgi:glyoxylase-like metal-dependent hydrolase (beta-lactamase superfamily II)
MPNMTRRSYLALTAAAALMPRSGFAAERLALGDGELVTLSDGNLTLPPEFIFGPAPQDALAELAAEMGIDLTAPLTPPCNVTLLRQGDRTILFDCGAGPAFQASAGRLLDALDAEGLTPDDITDVIFTHGHPDHLWGVLDDFDEPLFLNAAYKMGRAERDYWMDPDTVNTIGEARASFAAGASRRIEAIDGMLETFEHGAEVAPGVTAMATAGHTPGHMSFAVSSGDTTVMVIGDAVSNDHVAMARPDWPSGSDQDTEMGAATRARLLDQLATDQMLTVGFHMGGGGLGRVERTGEGYRFVSDI